MAIIDKPEDYFNTLLYTGDDADRSFSGVGFQPDLTWIKARNNTTWHLLYDAVRTAGTGKELHSNSTQAEGASNSSLYGYLSSFDSDGFSTVNGSSPSDALNETGKTYAAWNWKAGTSFTNDASATGIGSIDSTGSVNTTSGFSIVSFTDANSNTTIAHGLGVVPKVVIIKHRTQAEGWYSYWQPLGNNKQVALNATNASSTTGMWNNTTPTSTVFSLDTNTGGLSSGNYIAYCFAEKQSYSKFSSYVGNGNASGTYVHLGFKPAFLLIKQSGAVGKWLMIDNKRDPDNACNHRLNADVNNAESTGGIFVDMLSNGWKFRTTDDDYNTSGVAGIYMAFAENPFVTSTGVPATAR
jgi:hypothetical protein